MNLAQRFVWLVRLFVFPTARMHLHLPYEGSDRDDQWRKFSRDAHRVVREEIKSYLGDRYQGISFDIYSKSSKGIWGDKMETNVVFYLDLDYRIRDIEWLFDMKDVWGSRERFNQELMYIAFHPIWVMGKTQTEKQNEKRKAGSGGPAI
jgi:hypothetical protein